MGFNSGFKGLNRRAVSSVDYWQASWAHQPAGFVLLVQACVLQSCDACWLPTPFSFFPFTSTPVRHRVPSHFSWTPHAGPEYPSWWVANWTYRNTNLQQCQILHLPDIAQLIRSTRMCLRKTIPHHTTYLTKEFHAEEPFLSCHKVVIWPRIYQHFLEPKGSSPCSQDPATGRYHEPDKPNPYSPITLLYDSFQNYHPIHVYVFQTVSFLQVVNSKHSPIRATCSTHLISV